MLDCKNRDCQAVLAEAPRITDNLCEPCAEHFAAVREHLDARGVGLPGRPTSCAASTTTPAPHGSGPAPAWRSSISGGGRYDGLAEQLGGPPTPGVGFGAGIERLLEVARPEPAQAGLDVFSPYPSDPARPRLFALMDEVRAAGLTADAGYGGRRLKRLLELAGRRGAAQAVIVGEDEWSRNEAARA